MPTYRMIFLGNFPDIDRDERNFEAERAFATFRGHAAGSAEAPLYRQVLNVAMNDTDGDGRIKHDNHAGRQETISYDLDGLRHEREIDSGFLVRNVTVTRQLPDGRTDTVQTTVRIMQDTAGNVFMLPPPQSGGQRGEVAAVTSHPIIGIRFPQGESNFTTRFTGAYSERYDLAEFVPCFAAGTMIRTAQGPRPVEALALGDLVWTRDRGLQPIRWRGARRLGPDELAARPNLRPIRIAAGALGPGQPSQDLVVSPQHRVLVRSAIAARMFGAEEILVAATLLLEIPGIEVIGDATEVTYVHLMFDHHEVLISNGAETESLYPGPMALRALGAAAAAEIRAIFPGLLDDPAAVPGARLFATGRRARKLAARHHAKGRPLAG